VEGGGAIIRGRSGATFTTGLGGRETGRGAVQTESAFPRSEQTTNGARKGHRDAALTGRLVQEQRPHSVTTVAEKNTFLFTSSTTIVCLSVWFYSFTGAHQASKTKVPIISGSSSLYPFKRSWRCPDGKCIPMKRADDERRSVTGHRDAALTGGLVHPTIVEGQ
jgi:hypothetical protein